MSRSYSKVKGAGSVMPTYYNPCGKVVSIPELGLILQPGQTSSILVMPNDYLLNIGSSYNNNYWITQSFWSLDTFFDSNGNYRITAPYPDTIYLVLGKYSLYGILVTDEMPIYNPIISSSIITFNNSSDKKTISIKTLVTDIVELSQATCKVDVFLQIESNTPPVQVNINDVVTLQSKCKFNKLVLSPSGQGSVVVREMLSTINYERDIKNFNSFAQGGYE